MASLSLEPASLKAVATVDVRLSLLSSSQSVHDGRSARLVALQRGNMSRLPALFALQALIVIVIAEHNSVCNLSYCKCVPAKHPLRTNINCTVPGNKVHNSIPNKVFIACGTSHILLSESDVDNYQKSY
ncbi:unnamed protein product [Euphydryas editha]|uniref:Uncharacterized protein n=1 Tax=Euphydryas editha TaxID=104508 RepID=A0AAU9UWB2_EUPED|nr:unnamed protein product [Euphydryas editha]